MLPILHDVQAEFGMIPEGAQALIARLQAGKIYPTQSIDAALNNFFKVENLAALREVSLRQVAEDAVLNANYIKARLSDLMTHLEGLEVDAAAHLRRLAGSDGAEDGEELGLVAAQRGWLHAAASGR